MDDIVEYTLTKKFTVRWSRIIGGVFAGLAGVGVLILGAIIGGY